MIYEAHDAHFFLSVAYFPNAPYHFELMDLRSPNRWDLTLNTVIAEGDYTVATLQSFLDRIPHEAQHLVFGFLKKAQKNSHPYD